MNRHAARQVGARRCSRGGAGPARRCLEVVQGQRGAAAPVEKLSTGVLFGPLFRRNVDRTGGNRGRLPISFSRYALLSAASDGLTVVGQTAGRPAGLRYCAHIDEQGAL